MSVVILPSATFAIIDLAVVPNALIIDVLVERADRVIADDLALIVFASSAVLSVLLAGDDIGHLRELGSERNALLTAVVLGYVFLHRFAVVRFRMSVVFQRHNLASQTVCQHCCIIGLEGTVPRIAEYGTSDCCAQ